MIKISKEIELSLCTIDGVGHYSKFGAIIGEAEFILYYPEDSKDVFLAHISEFEKNGILIKLKDK